MIETTVGVGDELVELISGEGVEASANAKDVALGRDGAVVAMDRLDRLLLRRLGVVLGKVGAPQHERRLPVAASPREPDLILLRGEGEVARDESTVDESLEGELFADWEEGEDVGDRVVGEAGKLLRVVCRIARRQLSSGAEQRSTRDSLCS